MNSYIYTLKYYLLLFSFTVFSQLNGTYTIGNTNADYLTINNALTALNNQGVNGSVIFNIQNGNYLLSNFTFDTINGVSDINTITFQSEELNSNSVIINGQKIFSFSNNAQYITLKFLTFDVSNYSIKRVLKIDSGANNISIENCVFTGSYPVTTSFFNTNNTNQYNTTFISLWGGGNIVIKNNIFNNNGCAISKTNDNTNLINLSILNNVFQEFVTPISLKKITNLTLYNNQLNEAKYRTIDAYFLGGNIRINNNTINSSNSDLEDSASIRLNCSTLTGGNLLVYNNFFTLRNNIQTSYFNNIEFYHNSFYAINSSCLTIKNDSYLQDYQLINNVFYSPDEIPNITYNNDLSLITSKNNAYSNDINTILYKINYNETIYNLSDWQSFSNKDQNSLVVGNVYVSETNLHTPNALMLDGNAFPLTLINNDIDNQPRDISNPDIGADEFNMDFSTFTDLEIISIDSPQNIACEDTDVVLSIKNHSNFTINRFNIDCAINDFKGNIGTYNQIINPNQTIQLQLTHFTINKNTLYKKIKFYIETIDTKDNNYQNNYRSIYDIMQLGDFTILHTKDQCGNHTLTVPLIHNTTILWSTGEDSNQIQVNQAGNYSVTITDALGCEITKNIII